MIVKTFKTHKITHKNTDIFEILEKYLPKIQENSVVVVTSKIIAICEGRIVPINKANKDELVRQEADYYIPKEENAYGVYLTIKDNMLVATAGIDESNSQEYFVLWPKNPQKSANEIRTYLKKVHKVKNLGVIVTDSKTTPLRMGVIGAAIAHSGFNAVNDKIGTPDIFGKELKVTKVNVSDGLSAASVLQMGEGNEQTPLSVITDIPFVVFQDRNPNKKELGFLHGELKDDLYASVLLATPWQKGKAKK